MTFSILFFSSSKVNCQTEPECKKFHEIYDSSQSLCETLFGDAFTYETNLSIGYTMWFFDSTNPNDEITVRLGLNTTDECILDYYHKDYVTSESSNFTECHPWQSASCCHYETVKDTSTINLAYGEYYRWDRCGTLSQSCERFFVQEACFYECDPNVGLYRRYFNNNNTWEIYKMPIRSDYCDAWYRACYNDLFCATDSGNFFSCAKQYEAADNIIDGEEDVEELEGQIIVLIVVTVIAFAVIVGLVIFVGFLRNREKKGDPLFGVNETDELVAERVNSND